MRSSGVLRSEIVSVMETAKPRDGDDLRNHRCILCSLSSSRGSFVQPKVRPVIVEVANIFVHEALQVAFIQHDHVVEQIAAAGANPTFGHTVLPRTAEAGSFRLDAIALHGADDFFVEIRTAIKDQIARRRVVGKCLAQLLGHPCAGRMSRHIEVKDAPPVVGDDKEAIENTEGERWLSEEVHRCDDFTVVLQERRPSLCWLRISRRSSHPSQHRSFRDIEAEHLELAVNPRRAPGPVLGHHAEDKFTQLPAHSFSSRTLAMPGEPSPVELEASSMPAYDSLGLNEDQNPLQSLPEAPQHNPEESVGTGKSWPWAMTKKQ